VTVPADPDWDEGRGLLGARDPVLRRLVARNPALDPAAVFDGWGADLWTALLRQVTDQHISNASALAIMGRLRDRYGGRSPGPAEFLDAAPRTLAEVGYSRAKIGALTDAASRIVEGALSTERLARLRDEEARAELTGIKGIGRFTADGVLLLAFRRADVMPSADLQIRKAMAHEWALGDVPSVRSADDRARPWAPWRTLAAAYLYAGV
jgi:DNA-3-methyladenine glycosylase II